MSISAQALATFQRAMKEAPEVLDRELLAATNEGLMLLRHQLDSTIPRGWGGRSGLGMAGSITSDAFSTPTGALGVIGTSVSHAPVVELGRRPGKGVSEQGRVALGAWVMAVLGVTDPKRVKNIAFLISQKIKREGLPAQRPFGRAAEASADQIERMFEGAMGRVAQHLAGGSA